MHRLNTDRTAQDYQIFVATQTFALAFAEFEIAKVYAQQNDPTWLSTPLPVIAPEDLIRPIGPPILTKPVKNHGMQGLHRDVFLDVVWIERDVLKDW
jgi:hypothetical protein